MTYLKSILAGFLALALVALLAIIAAFIFHWRMLSATNSIILIFGRRGTAGTMLKAYELWIVALLVFGIGFDAEFRRLSKSVPRDKP